MDTQNLNPAMLTELQFTFNLISKTPDAAVEKFVFPDCYTNRTLNEKLWLLKMMIKDLSQGNLEELAN